MKVFDDNTVTAISHTKTIVDLPAIAIKLKGSDGGHIKDAVKEGPRFLHAVHSLPVRSLDDVSDDELKAQYREFLKRLEQVAEKYSTRELPSIDAKNIIKIFFDPKENLFTGIEMVMQAISVSCVKVSCESVLESLVSIFENHFDVRRNMNEESTAEEFMIAVNGPNLAHSDILIKEAMNSYWHWKGSGWHFFRTTVLERLKEFEGGSQVIDRIIKKHSRLPFMEM